VPPGVDARYATIALRATGGGSAVEWSVDGQRVTAARFHLRPGRHRIVARSASGALDSVTVQVD
jgi:hypothetical protein